MIEVVILAAGKGSRMRSNLPKVMHKLGGKPLLHHVLDRAFELEVAKTHVVVGHCAENIIENTAGRDLNFVEQREQLGTGHAVLQALPYMDDESIIVVLYGDVPLIKTKTLQRLIDTVTDQSMGLLTAVMDNPSGYGRIIRDDTGRVVGIVEQKDANDQQKQIKEINSGIMAMKVSWLSRYLPSLQNQNSQAEYYLTDIIAMAVGHGMEVIATVSEDIIQITGINDRIQQAQLERAYQLALADHLMSQGLTLSDPSRFDCRGTLTAGRDCFVDVNCIFEGVVIIGDNVTIHSNCVIKNCVIGDNTVIQPNTLIEDSEIANQCSVGPFARLRPGSKLSEASKIGNFVETKKSTIGTRSKVNHFTYIGDTLMGEDVNVGAGTITCNYDGANKHLTKIGDRVFVGSNSSLVAPVSIGDDATIGAGSTITRDVTESKLAIARAKQEILSGWHRPIKNKT